MASCLFQYIRPQVYGAVTKPDQVRIDQIMPPKQLNVQVSFEIYGNLTGNHFLFAILVRLFFI